MYTPKIEKEFRCPLEYGISILDGKWTARVICALYEIGDFRYGELKRKMGNVTDGVLNATLKALVKEGIIERRQYEEIPPRVEYSLSKKGHSLIPLLHSLCEWAEKNGSELEEYPFTPCSDCRYIRAEKSE